MITYTREGRGENRDIILLYASWNGLSKEGRRKGSPRFIDPGEGKEGPFVFSHEKGTDRGRGRGKGRRTLLDFGVRWRRTRGGRRKVGSHY